MIKQNILFLLFLSFFITSKAKASPTDSISTAYKNGEFVTYCQFKVNASDSICNVVTLDFEYQMRYNLDELFGWALKGMNLRKEKNELMVFYFKSTTYNKETNTIRGIGDVIVPEIITFPNIIVDSRISEKKYKNGTKSINIDLLNSNVFLKKMIGSFTVVPKKHKTCYYILETHIRFGWFFNFFITQKRYRSIIEWRLKRFVLNIRDEAERREKFNEKSLFKK